jgi:hypothetical protein
VPENEVWRELEGLDLRIRQGNSIALWIHWDESTNGLFACQSVSAHGNGNDDRPGSTVSCSSGSVPGSPGVLQTPFGLLYLEQSSIVGSGPTGPSVTMTLGIAPGPDARGEYAVDLAAADDFGGRDGFFQAGRCSSSSGSTDAAQRLARERYLSPNGLPAARTRTTSLRRLALVSARLAVSIQPTYRRRCEGASFSKCRHAAGRFLSAA